jgi:hypothetical protein
MVKWLLIAAVAALALGAAAYWLLKKDEASLVKERLHELMAKASKQSEEAPLAALGSAQAVSRLFADSCDLALDQPQLSGTYSREDVAIHCAAARAQFSKVQFSLHELKASLRTKLTAEARFTAMLSGSLKDGDSVREVRDVDALLVKADGKWRISSLKISSPIKK